ncbi:MAG TPA: DUF6266 family protein [Sphingobacteriaceae bacterium]
MGRYGKGILGSFVGKVGTVIGSSWRGISYMRSLPVFKTGRTPTDKQLEQQMRFGLMTRFLAPAKPLLEVGFKNYAQQQTAYNGALSYNIKNAITGVYPALEVDYPMIMISRGDLPGAEVPSADSTVAATVTFNWTDNTGRGKAKDTDQLMILAHCPALQESVAGIELAARSAATADVVLPGHFSGQVVHLWIAWQSANGKELSGTAYLATVNVA